MKFLRTKQYRIVPGCGLVYCDHKNFFTRERDGGELQGPPPLYEPLELTYVQLH